MSRQGRVGSSPFLFSFSLLLFSSPFLFSFSLLLAVILLHSILLQSRLSVNAICLSWLTRSLATDYDLPSLDLNSQAFGENGPILFEAREVGTEYGLARTSVGSRKRPTRSQQGRGANDATIYPERQIRLLHSRSEQSARALIDGVDHINEVFARFATTDPSGKNLWNRSDFAKYLDARLPGNEAVTACIPLLWRIFCSSAYYPFSASTVAHN